MHNMPVRLAQLVKHHSYVYLGFVSSRSVICDDSVEDSIFKTIRSLLLIINVGKLAVTYREQG